MVDGVDNAGRAQPVSYAKRVLVSPQAATVLRDVRAGMRIVRAEPGDALHRAMVALRHRVLRAPLGLCFSDADREAELRQLHFGLLLGREVVGTLLLVPPDAAGAARLRQMAVDPGCERRGFGAALLRHGQGEALGLGACSIVLSARETALGFYLRQGYVVSGARTTEVSLPHWPMVKHLRTD